MSQKELFQQLKNALMQGDSEALTELVKANLDSTDPLEMIQQGMMPGMAEIGDQFSNCEVFLPELLMAAEAWEDAMKIIKPKLLEMGQAMEKRGTIVIGTVQTDIHEIGKNILLNLFTTAGYEVHDLGCDVPAAKFLEEAQKFNADIIAVSAIMSTTVGYQKDIIDLLESRNLRDKFFVMVGGGVVTQEWADKIGADGYGDLASDAIVVANKLMAKKKGA